MTENFSEMAKAFGKPSKGEKTGAYISHLSNEDKAEIEAFSEWLKGKMSDASRASYRSYLAAAMVTFQTGGSRDDLSSSQRSAVNKYAEYLATKS